MLISSDLIVAAFKLFAAVADQSANSQSAIYFYIDIYTDADFNLHLFDS